MLECTRRFGKQNKTKMVNRKVLSVFNKKTATSRNNCYICGQFNLGGKMMKVTNMNTMSIKVLEVDDKTSDEPTEAHGNEETSLETSIIEAELVKWKHQSTLDY